jgi:hypothetical protein
MEFPPVTPSFVIALKDGTEFRFVPKYYGGYTINAREAILLNRAMKNDLQKEYSKIKHFHEGEKLSTKGFSEFIESIARAMLAWPVKPFTRYTDPLWQEAWRATKYLALTRADYALIKDETERNNFIDRIFFVERYDYAKALVLEKLFRRA